MAHISEDNITADDGVNLFYRSFLPDEKIENVVLCLHGMSSHSGFYANLGYSLAKRGVAFYALDLRGNGFSGKQGYIESIDRQISDINLIVENIRLTHLDKPLHLIGHSLGAGYVLRYVSNYSFSVKSVILISPAVKVFSKRSIRAFMIMSTMGFRILLTPNAYWDITIGWPDSLSKSEMGKIILSDPACVKKFTYLYTIGLMKVSGRALLRYANSVITPTLILQGERDSVVAPEGSKRLFKKLATKEKQLLMLPNADHDIFGLLLPTKDELTDEAIRVLDVIYHWITKFK